MCTFNYARGDDSTALNTQLCVFTDHYDIAQLKKFVTYIRYWGEPLLPNKLD